MISAAMTPTPIPDTLMTGLTGILCCIYLAIVLSDFWSSILEQ
jgi:hypothetical protein